MFLSYCRTGEYAFCLVNILVLSRKKLTLHERRHWKLGQNTWNPIICFSIFLLLAKDRLVCSDTII